MSLHTAAVCVCTVVRSAVPLVYSQTTFAKNKLPFARKPQPPTSLTNKRGASSGHTISRLGNKRTTLSLTHTCPHTSRCAHHPTSVVKLTLASDGWRRVAPRSNPRLRARIGDAYLWPTCRHASFTLARSCLTYAWLVSACLVTST